MEDENAGEEDEDDDEEEDAFIDKLAASFPPEFSPSLRLFNLALRSTPSSSDGRPPGIVDGCISLQMKSPSHDTGVLRFDLQHIETKHTNN
jgi:hypothetical protein